MVFYGVKSLIDASGKPFALAYPYPDNGVKYRSLNEKKFWSENLRQPSLFGASKFERGSAKAITITEGEKDAQACFQMTGSRFPVVSVRSSSSAKADCAAFRDYLNSFDRIYICFDNDKPGQDACRAVASLFDFNKVYHVKLTLKDAYEYLESGRQKDFVSCWYSAKRFLPEGIYSSLSDFHGFVSEVPLVAGTPYPFMRLQELTDGAHSKEIVLVTAPEGIGKTEFVRALEYHWLTTTDERIAVIHLEEDKGTMLRRLAGYHLQRPCHRRDSGVSPSEINQALDEIIRIDDRLHVYSHFGSTDPDVILDMIRFLVSACGCQKVILDHITMVVSGLAEGDERRLLDYLSTRLAMLVRELDFCLVLVSHINDDGATRGSRNISKIADVWVALWRDHLSQEESDRLTTKMTLKKNRPGSFTGPCGELRFNKETFCLEDAPFDLPPTNN